MSVKISFLTKFGVAEIAGVRSDAVVLPHMNLQRALLRKRPAADGALERLFSGVYPDVTHQLAGLLEGLQAYGALVHGLVLRSPFSLLNYLRLQPVMLANVKSIERRLDELLVAELALPHVLR